MVTGKDIMVDLTYAQHIDNKAVVEFPNGELKAIRAVDTYNKEYIVFILEDDNDIDR